MRNNKQKVQNLLAKGYSYIGMLAEALAKAKLMKNKLEKAEIEGTDNAKFIKELEKSMIQIRKDRTKYSNSLKKVFEELKGYGISIENME